MSTGNWGGYGLHLRGNIEGYLAAASTHKWLEVHASNHFTPFYSDHGYALQKRFLDHWLHDIDTGLLDPGGRVLEFTKASGGTGPVPQGCLRASHRELDPASSSAAMDSRGILWFATMQGLERIVPEPSAREATPVVIENDIGHSRYDGVSSD